MWNFISTLAFLLLFGILAPLVVDLRKVPEIPNATQVILIVLATFRLIRLFVYDEVMKWFRDLFWDPSPDGAILSKPPRGSRRVMADLLDCPWCLGIWSALFSVFVYFYFSWGPFLVFILAVAGASSFIQVVSNAVGWTAEHKKIETEYYPRS